MNRRTFIGGILALFAAPAVGRLPEESSVIPELLERAILELDDLQIVLRIYSLDPQEVARMLPEDISVYLYPRITVHEIPTP